MVQQLGHYSIALWIRVTLASARGAGGIACASVEAILGRQTARALPCPEVQHRWVPRAPRSSNDRGVAVRAARRNT